MKRIAIIATLSAAAMAVTPGIAWGTTHHVHYCNCGDSIGAGMCGTSSSSTTTSSTSGGTTTSSTSGGTTTSSTSGGTTTSSTSGGTTSTTSGGTVVPEPGMLGMMGLGFIGMAVSRRRRR